MYGLSAFGTTPFGSLGQESVESSTGTSDNRTTSGELLVTVGLTGTSGYTELAEISTTSTLSLLAALTADSEALEDLIPASHQTTTGSLLTQVVLTALSNYDEATIGAVNIETSGSVVAKVSLSSLDTYTQVNNRTSNGSLSVLVTLTAPNEYQETLLSAENISSTGSLSVSVLLSGLSEYIDTPVGVDNRSTSASLITTVVTNAISSNEVLLNLSSTGSLNTVANLNALSEAIENVIGTENVSSTAAVSLRVVLNSESSFFESTDSGWDAPTILFNEPRHIEEMSLTFDQLGRPVVFYKVNGNELYIYWFNAILQQNEIRFIANGKNPVAGFDLIDDTSDNTSDVMLFYVRDDTAFMRIQREDYAIEYNTGVTLPGMQLRSSGMRIDNRFQVVYTHDGAPQLEVTPENPGGVQPTDPEPPLDPNDPGLPGVTDPVDTLGLYRNNGMSSGSFLVANDVQFNIKTAPFKIGYTIAEIGPGNEYGAANNTTTDLWYHMFGLDSLLYQSRHLVCMMGLRKKERKVMFIFWLGANGYEYRIDIEDMPTVLGNWHFELTANSAKVFFNGELKGEDWHSTEGYVLTRSRLTFGGYRWIGSNAASGSIAGQGNSFDGALTNCWVEQPEYGRIDWPINDYGSAIQESIPAGKPIEIVNHRPSNWILIEE